MIEYRQTDESRLVLVDTSIWVASVRRPKSAVADELRMLIQRDEVATTEIIVAEVLQGAKTEEDFAEWSEQLDAPHFFPSNLDIWRRAAEMAFQLRTQGLTTPLADLVIASVALSNNLALYAADDDFSRVPGLRLYTSSNHEIRNQTGDSGAKEE